MDKTVMSVNADYIYIVDLWIRVAIPYNAASRYHVDEVSVDGHHRPFQQLRLWNVSFSWGEAWHQYVQYGKNIQLA
jgi:hypothetical protein